MPRDACDLLRNFDELVAQAIVSRDDLSDLIQECVGEQAEGDSSWIPLCPDYPNLKGVTCDEIDTFIDEHAPDISYNEKWREKLREYEERYDDAWKRMRERVEEYNRGGHPDWKDPEIEFWYSNDGEGVKLIKEVRGFLMDTLPEKDKKTLSEDSYFHGVSEMIKWAEGLNKRYDQREGWVRVEGRDFVKEYLKNVKVFDRDEEYLMFKDLGSKLAEDIWKNTSSDERKKQLTGSGNAGHINKNWSELSGVLSPVEMERLKNSILKRMDTIYVTTPRGGLECLSIFSYGNGLSKEQTPTDIEWPWDRWERQVKEGTSGDALEGLGYSRRNASVAWSALSANEKRDYGRKVVGTTWLGRETSPIQRIVMIDDIIASGEQVEHMYEKLKDTFGDLEIYGVHLCHRDPEELKYHKNPILEDGREVYGIETSGIRKWPDEKRRQEIAEKFLAYDVPIEGYHALSKLDKEWLAEEMYGGSTYLNEERLRLMKEYLEAPPKVITCAFPHSIADGESDKLLRELYGGRIHAETRRKGVK